MARSKKRLATPSTYRPPAQDGDDELSAVHEVFGVVELLENVLEYLPPRDLLRMKLLCRLVNHTINTSPTLQTKLFLKAAPESSSDMWRVKADGTIVVGDVPGSITDQSKPTRVVAYNPLLLRRTTPYGIRENHGIASSSLRSLELTNHSWLTSNDLPVGCLSMFLSQPPVSEVNLSFGLMNPPFQPKMVMVRFSKGVTFQDIRDVVHGEAAGRSLWGIVFPNCSAISLLQKEYMSRVEELPEAEDAWHRNSRFCTPAGGDGGGKVRIPKKKTRWVPLE